jgi:hypothetical protein
MRSRTNCFNSLDSGKRPAWLRANNNSPFNRTSNMPPVPGTKVTALRSPSNVISSSCAIQAARNSHRHCVQYSISICGKLIKNVPNLYKFTVQAIKLFQIKQNETIISLGVLIHSTYNNMTTNSKGNTCALHFKNSA